MTERIQGEREPALCKHCGATLLKVSGGWVHSNGLAFCSDEITTIAEPMEREPALTDEQAVKKVYPTAFEGGSGSIWSHRGWVSNYEIGTSWKNARSHLPQESKPLTDAEGITVAHCLKCGGRLSVDYGTILPCYPCSLKLPQESKPLPSEPEPAEIHTSLGTGKTHEADWKYLSHGQSECRTCGMVRYVPLLSEAQATEIEKEQGC